MKRKDPGGMDFEKQNITVFIINVCIKGLESIPIAEFKKKLLRLSR